MNGSLNSFRTRRITRFKANNIKDCTKTLTYYSVEKFILHT